MTGLFEATSGSAKLAGFDVRHETKFVYQNIGICPQFNILWDQLTVKEHILFYARVKGIGRKEEQATVDECLEIVELDGFESRLAKSLSCGEKRRLAIAIALVGNPKVIFLDEPTVCKTLHAHLARRTSILSPYAKSGILSTMSKRVVPLFSRHIR